ncbi:MAG: hypothetical protein QOD06_3240 [Candidatus Binatota bacterium]|nr:hypothetical protein [Candidatus Binatota bacterium]
MRVVVLLAAYNEERFIGPCLEHLTAHGCEAYLCDNDSSDRTVEIAERHLGRGLIAIERLPRDGVFSWKRVLARKEELAATIDADWFLHADPDEIRVPPGSGRTLAQALREIDALGYTAADFDEFTFVPTREAPDHDHPRYVETMRWYYPFLPTSPHQRKAWKRQRQPVDLVSSGGHVVQFPGVRTYPERFRMRHYLFLSVRHAIEKYAGRRYDPAEVATGWHGWRASVTADAVRLPAAAELRTYVSDEALDASDPRTRHCCDPATWR